MASHSRSSGGSGSRSATSSRPPGRPDAPAKSGGEDSLRAIRLEERVASRGRILEVATALVERDGADAFTMRKLAQALDCSPMGLYSYFVNKHDILHALAQKAFAALAERLADAPPGDPVAALRELFAELARFALADPAQYRTMFMTSEAQSAGAVKSELAIYAENPAFSAVVDRVRACIEAGAFAGDAHAATTLLWTAAHGAIAGIMIFPAFPFGEPERYVGRVVDTMLLAFRARDIEPL